ncbi:MAG TPA: glycosyltransferase [Elusimicrobiales bacterium]|nr:glycosyltransferase [Elusimicrobiales bacterium]
MKISVVIPAFNEEKLLGLCIDSVRAAFAAQEPRAEHEIIVCDNNSSDATAALAAARGVKVVFEPLNRIGGARNCGAAAAAGGWLLFLDADSVLSAATLRAALQLMRGGAVAGGGAVVGFLSRPPWWGRWMPAAWNLISRVFSLAAGSFVFCRADAFRAVGGFSCQLYAADEFQLSLAVRRWGRARGLAFSIITSAPHFSSSRKFFMHGFPGLVKLSASLLVSPLRSLKSAAHLPLYYDGKR